MPTLIADVVSAQRTPYPPSTKRLAQMLADSAFFDRAAALILRRETAPPLVLAPPAFAPAPAFAAMRAPRIETVGDLARWLDTPVERLDWFADERRRHGRTEIPILQHYNYRFVPRRSGGVPRLIEAPKSCLKAIQRRILNEILNLAPAHSCAHGFVRGRSCLSGAHLHAGENVVICADLKDFFPSIRAARIHGLFRSFGYPPGVSRTLTGLCTTTTPRSVLERTLGGAGIPWVTRKIFSAPHLAQGAPTSPALANLCAWRLDQRCDGLARSLGGAYTRYADDLTFSGDAAFGRRVESLVAALKDIASEEGFAINPAKTRVMRRAGQQRVTGIVVNDHVNVARSSYDALKATLHNCAKFGAASQNQNEHADFRAFLDGRVGWVEQVNISRGAKLRAMFDAINWA